VTLAELASVYPTAGGQYHFTSILAPQRYNRQFSYICGMISTLSWTINAASVALIGSQLLVSFPQFFNGYEPERWHLFLIYQGLNLFSLFYNLFLLKRTNWIHDCACTFNARQLCILFLTNLRSYPHSFNFLRHMHYMFISKRKTIVRVGMDNLRDHDWLE
jgi:choline transport protein